VPIPPDNGLRGLPFRPALRFHRRPIALANRQVGQSSAREFSAGPFLADYRGL